MTVIVNALNKASTVFPETTIIFIPYCLSHHSYVVSFQHLNLVRGLETSEISWLAFLLAKRSSPSPHGLSEKRGFSLPTLPLSSSCQHKRYLLSRQTVVFLRFPTVSALLTSQPFDRHSPPTAASPRGSVHFSPQLSGTVPPKDAPQGALPHPVHLPAECRVEGALRPSAPRCLQERVVQSPPAAPLLLQSRPCPPGSYDGLRVSSARLTPQDCTFLSQDGFAA